MYLRIDNMLKELQNADILKVRKKIFVDTTFFFFFNDHPSLTDIL